MKAFDLHRMAFDKVPFDFLGEVALRSLYTFVLVFLFLKMTEDAECGRCRCLKC